MSESQPASERRTTRRPRRRWLRILVACLALLVVALLSFPLWSTWLTPPLASWLAGVEMEELDSPSWTRWAISDLVYQQTGVDVQVDSVELPSPTGWILAQVFGNRDPLGLTARGWTVALEPTDEQAPPQSEPLTPYGLFEQINKAFKLLHEQLGDVVAENGVIVANGETLATIERVALDAETAEVVVDLPSELGPARLRLDRSNPQLWEVSLEADSPDATADLAIEQEEDRLAIRGDIHAFQNAVQVAAQWNRNAGLGLPDQARVGFDQLQLDHQRFEFWPEDYPLDLQGQVVWADQSYQFDLQSLETGRLQSDIAHTIDIEGSGNLQAARIEKANIKLPWLTAQNNAPLELDFSLANPLSDAALDLTIDFQELPWAEGSGRLDTRLAVTTSDDGQPIVSATAESDRIQIFDTTINEIGLSFFAEGKRLVLESLNAATAQGSNIIASGVVDLEASQIESFSLQADLQNESERLQQLVPVVGWQTVDLQVEVSGPFNDPIMDVALDADTIKLPSLHPLDIALLAKGRLSDLEASLTANRDTHSIELALRSSFAEQALQTTINRLQLSEGDTVLLRLENEAQLSFDLANGQLAARNLILDGGAAEAFLRLPALEMGPDALIASATIRNLSTGLLAPWIETTAPPLEVEEFVANLQLSPESSAFDISLRGLWHINEDATLQAVFVAEQEAADQPQLAIDQLAVGAAGRSFFQAHGRFPLSLGWADSKPTVDLRQDAPISLAVDSSPNPDFWNTISDLLPVSIERPVVNAQFTGTLAEPQGSARVQLQAVRWSSPEAPEKELALQDIRVLLNAEPDLLTLESASARLGQNTFRAGGTVSLEGAQMEELLAGSGPPRISNYQGTLTLEATDLQAVREWIPDMVRSQGQVQVKVELAPDEIRANATFENLATRPMPPLGSFSEISGEIVLEDERLVIRSLDGLAEQSPFQLAGSVDLKNWQNPRYDLAFTSQQFPLVRQSGMLIESDIDVELVSGEEEYPDIRGTLNLTKGLILTEPELLASNTKSTAQRPPYFSVAEAPFSNWGLDVEILGDEFLRVSNAFFQGTLSVDFLLDGTLENPLLVGKATTDAGRIFFPATALTLNSGEAYITRDRPSDIQLNAQAQGSLYEYEINLDVTGELSDPKIEITTNPAMTQVEALVFVTTGVQPDEEGLAKQSASSIGLFLGKGLFRRLLPSDSGGGDKLRLEVGRDTTEQGKKTIEAAYQLSDDLEIEGEYNKQDEYNANLKWTFFER